MTETKLHPEITIPENAELIDDVFMFGKLGLDYTQR